DHDPLLIGADGKIMKCTVALDTKDYNIVGRMTPDGRADLDVDKFTKWVKPYFEDDAVCKKCFYVPVCQGCSCPIPRIEENERPCPPEKKEIGRTLASIWAVKQETAKRRAVRPTAAEMSAPVA
ncbi:MAG TPA: SPASM domain-containing protein, partial [Bryobacteraceae bacterium]